MELGSLMFRFSILIIAVLTLSNAEWQGTLNTANNETYIMHLPRGPVWSPPPVPSYQEFRTQFDTLPADAKSAQRRRVFGAEEFSLRFELYLWADTLVFGYLYLCFRRNARDPVLHLAVCLAATLTSAAIVSFAFWLLAGGFISPLPEILAGVAIAVGLIVGRSTFKQKDVNSLASA
jgi:hypothetical protein